MAIRAAVGASLVMMLCGCSLIPGGDEAATPTSSVTATEPSSPPTDEASTVTATLDEARRTVSPAVARLLVTRWEQGMDADGEHELVACRMYTGTGFFVEPSLLVTAAHVVEDHNQVRITIGNKALPGEVVGFSATKDVALVRVAESVDDVVAFGATPVEVGDQVGTLGYSAGRGISFDRGDVNRVGVKVEVDGQFRTQLVEVNFAATSGNSGAPVFNQAGEVVGIHVAGLMAGAGQRLFVPAGVAEPLIQEWMETPDVSAARVSIRPRALHPAVALVPLAASGLFLASS